MCENVLTLGYSMGTGSTLWHHMHRGTCALHLSVRKHHHTGHGRGTLIIDTCLTGACGLSKPLSTYPHTKRTCNKLQFCDRADHWARPNDLAAQGAHSHGPERVHKTHARYNGLTTGCCNQQAPSAVDDQVLFEYKRMLEMPKRG